NVLLDCQQVGELAVVLVAPQTAVGARVDQLGADDELVAPPHYASGDHTFNFQVVCHSLGVDILPLVAKHRRAGHDGKVGQLRESIDQALRDAVTPICGI